MTSKDDRLTVEAAALARGDLSDLRPDSFDEIDAEFSQALQEEDVSVAANLIREIAARWRLSARLHTFERELADGLISESVHIRAADGYAGLPGDPGSSAATVWTCPKPPPHYRKQQRIEGQDMGSCPTHGTTLVREQPL